jgi:hypothetical protein
MKGREPGPPLRAALGAISPGQPSFQSLPGLLKRAPAGRPGAGTVSPTRQAGRVAEVATSMLGTMMAPDIARQLTRRR